jgi:hypothetical protein
MALLDHAEIGHSVHAYSHVVACDGLLGRDIQSDNPQAHLDHAVDERDDEKEPGPFGSRQAAQAEDHATLVLLNDLDGREQDHDQEDDENAHTRKQEA